MQLRFALSSVYEQILNTKVVLNWGSHPKLVSSYSEVLFSGKVISCLSRRRKPPKTSGVWTFTVVWVIPISSTVSVRYSKGFVLSFATSLKSTLTTGLGTCLHLCWVGGDGHGKDDQGVSFIKPKQNPLKYKLLHIMYFHLLSSISAGNPITPLLLSLPVMKF